MTLHARCWHTACISCRVVKAPLWTQHQHVLTPRCGQWSVIGLLHSSTHATYTHTQLGLGIVPRMITLPIGLPIADMLGGSTSVVCLCACTLICICVHVKSRAATAQRSTLQESFGACVDLCNILHCGHLIGRRSVCAAVEALA